MSHQLEKDHKKRLFTIYIGWRMRRVIGKKLAFVKAKWGEILDETYCPYWMDKLGEI